MPVSPNQIKSLSCNRILEGGKPATRHLLEFLAPRSSCSSRTSAPIQRGPPMLAQLEHLRFLRRAADEGLITDSEHAQHRQAVLLCVRSLPILAPRADAAAPPSLRKCLHMAAADEQKRVGKWHALLEALAEAIECHDSGRHRSQKPGFARHEVPRQPQQAGQPARRKHVFFTPPEDTGAAHRARSAAAPGRFVYNRRGLHCKTREPLPSIDPLDFDMEPLWHEHAKRVAATPRPSETADKGCQTGCSYRLPPQRPRKLPVSGVARCLHARAAASACMKTCSNKTKPPVVQAAAPVTKARPPLATTRGVPAAAPPHARNARKRSPSEVRRAAVYVAKAAGLRRRADAPEEPRPRGEHCLPSAPQPEGKRDEGPTLRLTLHAELAL